MSEKGRRLLALVAAKRARRVEKPQPQFRTVVREIERQTTVVDRVERQTSFVERDYRVPGIAARVSTAESDLRTAELSAIEHRAETRHALELAADNARLLEQAKDALGSVAGKSLARADHAIDIAVQALTREYTKAVVIDLAIESNHLHALMWQDGQTFKKDIGQVRFETKIPWELLGGGGGGGGASSTGGSTAVTVITTAVPLVITPTLQGKVVVLADATVTPVLITLPSTLARSAADDVTVIRQNVIGFSVSIIGIAGQLICNDAGPLVLNTARIGNTSSAELTPVNGNWWIT